MGKRGQVAGGPDAALLGNPGVDAGVEELSHPLDELRLHSRVPRAQDAGPQQHDGAGRREVEGIAYANGVAADEVLLQDCKLVVGDSDLG